MKNVKNMNDIANGFIFNFGTMAGSQGDDFKADLTKDGITYRVRVFHDFGYNGFDDVEILEVRKYEQNFADDSFTSLWNKDGEVVEAFEAAQELSYTRRINSMDDDTKSAIAPEKAIEKVRAHRGYKRTKVEDIKRIVRKNNKYTGKVTYVVEFKNRVSKTADFTLNLN